MERGIVGAGRDPERGEHGHPALELTRLAIPRRTYTQPNMDVVAKAVKAPYDAKEKMRDLRFFQARFEPLA